MSNVNTTTETTQAVKRGRPVVAGSKRQAILAMRDAKRNAGVEIKRGRPKKTTDVTVEVKAKPSKAQRQAKMATATADVNEA